MEKSDMAIMRNRKQQISDEVEKLNKERTTMLGEKENCYYLGISEVGTLKQVKIKMENEQTSRNQAEEQKSHQKHKHLGGAICDIFGNIPEVDEGRNSTNGPGDKKANDEAKDPTSQR